ncbi:hypothetical protein QTO34_009978 [Cnephaeus nilssonii]|uniref:Uncharacterized protein n=1 Tax=Cnephaeus nilssonii TaxID=3371016 RepID=A0AA40HFI0_CNENI|nr:hypothetical protein QTO34_009978 [Eptesicus nilssonii]
MGAAIFGRRVAVQKAEPAGRRFLASIGEKGWLFREDKAILGFLACDTLTETFCSVGASTFSAPQQQPEEKEMLVSDDLPTTTCLSLRTSSVPLQKRRRGNTRRSALP